MHLDAVFDLHTSPTGPRSAFFPTVFSPSIRLVLVGIYWIPCIGAAELVCPDAIAVLVAILELVFDTFLPASAVAVLLSGHLETLLEASG